MTGVSFFIFSLWLHNVHMTTFSSSFSTAMDILPISMFKFILK